jgi:hypothetical protein
MQQMGMKNSSLFGKTSPAFIALTVIEIHHFVSVWQTGESRSIPEFGP